MSETPGCEGCPLKRLYPNNAFVPPQLGPSLRLVVAEAPGEEEALQGKPLVGGSGKVFDSLCRKAGIKRDELNIINTVNCRPPDNVYPTDAGARSYCTDAEAQQATRHCFEAHVKPLLESRPWTRIDAVGDKALRALTAETGVTKWRGSPLPLRGELERRVMPLLHPSFLMRTQYLMPAFVSDLKKGLQVPPEHYVLNPTLEELEQFRNARVLCFDIETAGHTSQITMVGLSIKPYHVTVVPYTQQYRGILKDILHSASAIVSQNGIGFDVPTLVKNGFEFPETQQHWDIMLMQHLLQPDMDHDLEFISSIFTQKPAWKHLSGENMALYCARDVDVTLQSFLQLKPTLEMQGLMDLYQYCQVPLAKICKQMSDTGIKQDGNRIKSLRVQFTAELAALEAQLPKELQPYDKPVKKRAPAPPGTIGKSGKPAKFISVPATKHITPWNSPAEITKWLYVTLGLPKQVHPKTKKLSTDKSAIERIVRKLVKEGRNELADQINALKKVRQLDELLSTFLKEDDKVVATGEVHAGFLVHGTSTGRLSSSNPNMQNIPAKSRFIYVPPVADWCFIEADFSSLENRLAAWYADDRERLGRLSIPGFNEHKWLTSKIYGIPEDEVDKDSWQYKRGKNTNHGADGAMGARKLSMTYDIPYKEADELITLWRKINHKSAKWQSDTGDKALREGLLVNAFGRKRWFWSQQAYTEGIRFLPQSTGADICFRAMIALMYERIKWPTEWVLKVSGVLAPLPQPAKLVLQVHDSLLVAAPQALVPECVSAMRLAMEQPWDPLGGFNIPAAFKVGAPGASWGEVKPYSLEDN